MELTSENVEKIFMKCFTESQASAVKCDVVVHSFLFSRDKLQEYKEDIVALLSCLPEEFMTKTGGGCSFLAACNDRNGNQWTGLHLMMEKLFALGIGIGKVKCLVPRELWVMLPGEMPYFVVL